MKKRDIVKRMAKVSGVSPGEAADRLDRVVRDIFSSIRKGKPAALPGLGRFTHAEGGKVGFEPEAADE